MALDRQNGDIEGQRWDRFWGWGRQGRGWDPVGEDITEPGDGQELLVLDGSRNVLYGAQQKVEHMEYVVSG